MAHIHWALCVLLFVEICGSSAEAVTITFPSTSDVALSETISLDEYGNLVTSDPTIASVSLDTSAPIATLYSVPCNPSPCALQQQWNNPNTWDDSLLNYDVDAVAVYTTIVNTVTNAVSTTEDPTAKGILDFGTSVENSISSIRETLSNTGPTQQTLSVGGSIFDLDLSASIGFSYDIIVQGNSNVVMNQNNITVSHLTVLPGGVLTGNNSFVVQGNVVNGGEFENLAGVVQGTLTNNSGATVQVAGGQIQGLTVNWGILQVANTVLPNLINKPGGTADFYHAGVDTSAGSVFSNQGQLNLHDGSYFTLRGVALNSGSIDLDANNSQATIFIPSVSFGNTRTVLTGGGTITLSDNPNNAILGQAFYDTGVLVNRDNTIQGAGTIGGTNAFTALELINQGTIDATGTNPLILNASGFNSGLMEATNGGTLQVVGSFDNYNGTIEAQSASTVDIYGSISNGLIEANGGTVNLGGTITRTTLTSINGGTLASYDGTLARDTLSIGSTITIGSSTDLLFEGTFTNNGTVSLQSNGEDAPAVLFIPSVSFGNTRTVLTGGGTITLSDNPGNAILGQASYDTGVLVNRDNTIQGAGTIGGTNAFTALELINQGTIDATGTNPLILNASGFNSGLMEATNGGTLQILGSFDNYNGTIEAQSASTVDIYGSISNGLIEANGGTVNLGGTISNATIQSANGGTIQLAGGQVLGGNVDIQSGGTLTGAGTIPATLVEAGGNLAPGSDSARVMVTGNIKFATGSRFTPIVSPVNASSIQVAGTATLGGTLDATATGGNYSAGEQFTIISAASGISGTFSLTSSGSFGNNLMPTLIYQSNELTLQISISSMSAFLPANSSFNARSVSDAIDHAIAKGDVIPLAIEQLGNSRPGQVAQAISSLGGDMNSGFITSSLQASDDFLSLITDPTLENRLADVYFNSLNSSIHAQFDNSQISTTPNGLGRALGHQSFSLPVADGMTLWGSEIGNGLSPSTSIRPGNMGYATGLTLYLSPSLKVGAAIADGTSAFSSAVSTLGAYNSVLQIALFTAVHSEDTYVTGGVQYTAHRFGGGAPVQLAGTTPPTHDISARLETGWQTMSALLPIPFIAMEVQSIGTPANTQLASIHNTGLEVEYHEDRILFARSELGGRLEKSIEFAPDSVLSVFGRAAWAHEWAGASQVNAALVDLRDEPFSLQRGTRSWDSAIISSGIDWHLPGSAKIGMRFDGVLGGGTPSSAATIVASWTW